MNISTLVIGARDDCHIVSMLPPDLGDVLGDVTERARPQLAGRRPSPGCARCGAGADAVRRAGASSAASSTRDSTPNASAVLLTECRRAAGVAPQIDEDRQACLLARNRLVDVTHVDVVRRERGEDDSRNPGPVVTGHGDEVLRLDA